MSIQDIRNTFNRVAEGKLRCDRALMVYGDATAKQGAGRRDHQLVYLHCTDGKVHEFMVKPGEDILAVTAKYARTLIPGDPNA